LGLEIRESRVISSNIDASSRITVAVTRRLSLGSQVLLVNIGKFHEMPLETRFERLVSVHWNRDAKRLAFANINMMTAIDTRQIPTFGF